MTATIEIENLTEMEAFGRKLGAQLFPGSVVALTGPLGAGKTHLTRAIAEGLQIPDANLVTSPTFVLIQEYDAKYPIYHFDAYRLTSVEEFNALGVDEYFHGEGVCVVEWADKVKSSLPADRIWIEIQPVDANRRTLLLTFTGKHHDLLYDNIIK